MATELANYRAVQELRRLIRLGGPTDLEVISIARRYGIQDYLTLRQEAWRAERAAQAARQALADSATTLPDADPRLREILQGEIAQFSAMRGST